MLQRCFEQTVAVDRVYPNLIYTCRRWSSKAAVGVRGGIVGEKVVEEVSWCGQSLKRHWP
jgi:hypothetical protein